MDRAGQRASVRFVELPAPRRVELPLSGGAMIAGAWADPLVRMATLLVLGAALHVGGWRYERVDSIEDVAR
ncbi:MAG: hypothetical protein R3E88_03940 [Myxococcota bacterium]